LWDRQRMLAPTKALSKWRASGCFICQGYGGLLARGARAAERDADDERQ
jgi:hypothetical protein